MSINEENIPLTEQTPDVHGDQALAKPDALNTYDPMGSMAEWNSAVGNKHYSDEDTHGKHKELSLRLKLISEEYRELVDEILDKLNKQGDDAKLAKEVADLLYVTYGLAELLELPMYQIFRAVHSSNMSKMGEDGKPIRNSSGKVLKGPGYFEPDIKAILGVSS